MYNIIASTMNVRNKHSKHPVVTSSLLSHFKDTSHKTDQQPLDICFHNRIAVHCIVSSFLNETVSMATVRA